MLGLFGKKKEPETLLKKEKDRYGGSGFDPTGLERAAKAAREIDASAHARLAFDVIQAREATKRLEHGTRQAAYEMRAREYEMQSVGKEGAEARQTLAAQTDHANRQAEYADQLERRRYAANLGAQRDARAAELQRHEASLARQEELRRRTLRYEAELREKTELKRAEAEATARARAERETHDLSLARMRAEAAERRETLLRSIGVSFETAGAGLRAFLGDREQMARAVGIASALALGVYGARAAARVAGDHAAARLGRPSLVRETSRASPLDALRPAGWRRLLAPAEAGGALDGVVLEPALEKRLGHVAAATKNTRANAAPFRHVLLHGPPGTGKTLFAKKLARASGLDYAILTGGDVAPLGRDAVTEIHRLFDWAATSRRGLLLFIDEADAFLRSRREATSEDLRNAFNAFLYRTGEPSRDVMLVYASNAAEDFDWAVNDRIDEMVRFSLPGRAERARMLRQYLDEYFGAGDIADAKLDGAVAATEGFSGREINKLVVAWKAAASVGAGGALDDATRAEVLDAHVEQRAVKSGWNALAAA
jgi:ATPase family AAA domain-containing protein 3A/B